MTIHVTLESYRYVVRNSKTMGYHENTIKEFYELMNIFYLDSDPVKAAQVQYNKHVVKMILESAQMLCTAHHHYEQRTQCTL